MIEIVYHGEAAAAFGPDGQAGGFENADGNGEIHLYPLLDGVSAMCLRLEMGSYTEIRTQIGMLEINFCANGRFETRFSLRDHVLLKPGDMAISCYDGVHGTMSESHFPLGLLRRHLPGGSSGCRPALDRAERAGAFRGLFRAQSQPPGQ